jgi:hypothetical protein
MASEIDRSVYPDIEDTSGVLDTIEGRADYVQRICAAWDFDVVPTPQTFTLFEQWQDVFDRFPLLHSVAYHTFRARFGWPELPADASLLDVAFGDEVI